MDGNSYNSWNYKPVNNAHPNIELMTLIHFMPMWVYIYQTHLTRILRTGAHNVYMNSN